MLTRLSEESPELMMAGKAGMNKVFRDTREGPGSRAVKDWAKVALS